MRFVRTGGAVHVDGDELGRALAVAGYALRQVRRDFTERRLERFVIGAVPGNGRMPGLAGRRNHEGIVGRGIAVNGDAVERHIGHFFHQSRQHRLRHRGVGCNKGQHGRHIWLQHADTLGHAGNRHFRPAYEHAARTGLGDSVRCHDRLRGAGPVGCGKACLAGGQRRRYAIDRQVLKDDAGGKGQHLGVLAA